MLLRGTIIGLHADCGSIIRLGYSFDSPVGCGLVLAFVGGWAGAEGLFVRRGESAEASFDFPADPDPDPDLPSGLPWELRLDPTSTLPVG